MRFLIYGINFAPELTGVGKYTGELVDWLASRGNDVRVITAPPYYPEWKIKRGYSAWRYRREIVTVPRPGKTDEDSFSYVVFRTPVWVPERPTGLTRILHLASFSLSSLPILARHAVWKPDVVFVIEPTFFCVPSALLIARLARAEAWLHIQDFEIDAAFGLGLLRRKRLRRSVEAIERFFLTHVDRVSTISKKMLERVQEKAGNQMQCVMFPNWVDTHAIHPLDRQSNLRSEWAIGKQHVVLLYSGNMGEKQGLEIIIETAQALVREERFLFVMCGTGAAIKRLKKLGNGLTNVLWKELQPVERLNELLNLADIHLLPQQADAADLVMPSKLTGMLASGRPIIATAQRGTQVATVVEGSGIVVEPGDLEGFVTAVRRLADQPGLRTALGAAARRFAEKELDRDAVLLGFEEDVLRLVESSG